MKLKVEKLHRDGYYEDKKKQMEFVGFPKMARLSREIIVTEKIDGTNAQVCIGEDDSIFAGSRTRWITPQDDNYGFAAWVEAHHNELLTLGPGRHFGEWWGAGIQRGYGLKEKRFSLFNVQRWAIYGTQPQRIATANPSIEKWQDMLPECCGLVPILYRGKFCTQEIEKKIELLRTNGSMAVPGFMKPEGIVVFHVAGSVGFKKTLENDEMPKSLVKLQSTEI